MAAPSASAARGLSVTLLKCSLALALSVSHSATAADFEVPAFPFSESEVTLRGDATSHRFISAHGRRGMLVGYAAESLEGWIYPFRIFHDYRIGFRLGDSPQTIPGSAVVREVIVNPESVTRVYATESLTLRETLFVPLDEPGLLVLYEADSKLPVHLEITFRPDLDLMWPGGMGGQSYDWDAERHAFVMQESSGKYSALLGSPAAGQHSSPDSYAEPWRADRALSFELDIPANSRSRVFPVAVALTAPPHYDANQTYGHVLERSASLYSEAAKHYRDLLAHDVRLETPDRQFNLAYQWARIALDQACVCNPWLGCGLVAGYGPSRDTRRPQFAWFFGGDALINTFALEAAGDRDLARDAIRFVQKYQRKETGEIFHELSQSAGLIRWFEDYPYAYRHTDISAVYLMAMRNLYRASGDADFVRSSWDSLKSAYKYLVSRIDPADGLVTVPTGGWGGDETIGQQVVKDIYLESAWVAGADAMEGLASFVGDRELAGDAHGRAEKARASLAREFWNPVRTFFYYGFNGRGELLKQELNQPAWGIWNGAFSNEMAEAALDHMSGADWLTDWGGRSMPANDPEYIANSYGHGSVWPLGSGEEALAFYSYHRPQQAEPLVRALVKQTFLDSLGHVPEVFSGDFYRELDVAVPEQIWSSGIVITSLMRGMLGINPYAPMGELQFSPHLPKDWSGVTIDNLSLGRSALRLKMERTTNRIVLYVESAGPPVALTFAPEIPSEIRTLRATVNGRPAIATIRNYQHDRHAELKFTTEPKTEAAIALEPGEAR